jgi:hypothetical protein
MNGMNQYQYLKNKNNLLKQIAAKERTKQVFTKRAKRSPDSQ